MRYVTTIGLCCLLGLGCIIQSPIYSLTIDKMRRQAVYAAHKDIASLSGHLWGLTDKQWTRYQQLMRGPAGRWYPQLDPPEVLGLFAQTEVARQHYAKIVVQQRKARIDRELAFNRAVHEAWVSEYSNLKPIKPFDARPFRMIKNKASLMP